MQAKQFVVAVEPGKLRALADVVKRHQEVEEAWLKEARETAGLTSLRGPDATAARQSIRQQRAELRETGELRGSRDLVIAHEVRAELAARGLAKHWDPIPQKDSGAAGRPTGADSSRYPRTDDDKPALSARMPVRLPDELGNQVVRGCYWYSAPAVDAVRVWQRRWGDGPMVILRKAQRSEGATPLDQLRAGMAPRATVEALERLAAVQAQIITSGDIIRAALDRAIQCINLGR
ncbi:hypothetical protein ACN6LF_001365 [[Kitasatospora] papulosa]|uniref:hypothetical protein n=1 Tax=[Kitasatospora] papulosa TaxID=1464011 RepID=UPI00403CF794